MDSETREMLLQAWRTNNRVTIFLIENIPSELWRAEIPTQDRKSKMTNRKSIRMLLGHLHNSRCMWIKTLGSEHGIQVPQSVDRYKVTQKQLITALGRSSRAVEGLLKLGCDNGGTLPSSRRYTWRNLPLDVGHVLTYLTSHEAHHRGQVILAARQLGHRMPTEVSGGIWHFVKRARETRGQ